MFGEEIDYFHAPEITVEIFFALGIEQLSQQRRGIGSLRDHLQEFRRRLGDAAIAEERFAQRRFRSLGTLHLFLAGRANCFQDLIDQRRIVRRPDRHRISDFVVEAPAGQVDFEMTRILFRAFAAEAAVDR